VFLTLAILEARFDPLTPRLASAQSGFFPVWQKAV
jgi:hypothetical protein